MTPFMLRVAELVGAEVEPEAVPMPATRLSRRIETGTGADRQVALRSLAEQLVCEANAVLGGNDEPLALVDEIVPDELAFSITYRGRRARVSTTFVGGVAIGRLIGDGLDSTQPVELDSPDSLPDLLVRLLLESGVRHHPVHL